MKCDNQKLDLHSPSNRQWSLLLECGTVINRLIPFVADMIKTAENAGLVLYDKVILKKPMGTAPSRVKMWNTRKTVRIHEELLVFKK